MILTTRPALRTASGIHSIHGGSLRRSTSIAILMLLAMPIIVGGQANTIRVPVRVVVVPTLVFAKGHYVDGLQAGDFRLYDAGRPQQFKLETDDLPVSAVVAIQSNRDVREYIPFISKIGNLLENSIAGADGRVAVLSYNDAISVLKPFGAGNVSSSVKQLSAGGSDARMIDAGLQAIKMLGEVKTATTRVLLFVGQTMDRGSKMHLDALRSAAERENVAIYCLKLPEAGKAFIADSLSFAEKDGSGMQVGIELTKGIPALRRTEQAKLRRDPFTILSTATGGVEIPFRKQQQLENGLIAIGASLRSRYLLSYSPDAIKPGYHEIRVQVDKPGVTVYSRPGYTAEAQPRTVR